MSGGKIIIEGKINWACDGIANNMKGGELIVKGDAGLSIGYHMSGGRVVIHGNVILQDECPENFPDLIGEGMTGGEIHINGELEGIKIGDVVHGKIFHNGKLIVDK
jgi:formylmethanofuran dehydrogenase subunit C